MKNPSIVINGEVFIAPEPKMKLWRQMADFRKQIRQQSDELVKQWEKADILRKKRDSASIAALEKLLGDIGTRVDELNEERTLGKLAVIEMAFGEIPLNELALAEIPVLYDLIDTWVSSILTGRTNELPNVETPAE